MILQKAEKVFFFTVRGAGNVSSLQISGFGEDSMSTSEAYALRILNRTAGWAFGGAFRQPHRRPRARMAVRRLKQHNSDVSVHLFLHNGVQLPLEGEERDLMGAAHVPFALEPAPVRRKSRTSMVDQLRQEVASLAEKEESLGVPVPPVAASLSRPLRRPRPRSATSSRSITPALSFDMYAAKKPAKELPEVQTRPNRRVSHAPLRPTAPASPPDANSTKPTNQFTSASPRRTSPTRPRSPG